MIESLKASWEIVAGVVPGTPVQDWTKRWHYTSAQREEDEKHGSEPNYHSTFAKMRAEALDYYSQISMPHYSNWAQLTFIWY